MRIFWTDVPKEVRAVIKPHVKRFEPLLPRWVERLHIFFGPDDEGVLASVDVAPEYRSVRITVTAGYLTQDDNIRAMVILHEFIHVPQGGMSQVFTNLLDSTMDEDDQMYDWVSEEWRKACESQTSDLEYGIARLMGIKVPGDWSVR